MRMSGEVALQQVLAAPPRREVALTSSWPERLEDGLERQQVGRVVVDHQDAARCAARLGTRREAASGSC